MRGSSAFTGLYNLSVGEGHGNPFPYSCLENLMDRGTWLARVHRVIKSWTRLKQLSTGIQSSPSFPPISSWTEKSTDVRGRINLRLT